MFLWGAAVILLYRKGYATDVRRDCLALSLWLLIEAHAAGEERLLSPSNRPPPRQKRPLVSPTISVSENTVPKRDGGSPQRSGGEGGGGGGNNDVSSAGGGVDDWAANVASREHSRFVHLALVSTEGFPLVYLVRAALASVCLDIIMICWVDILVGFLLFWLFRQFSVFGVILIRPSFAPRMSEMFLKYAYFEAIGSCCRILRNIRRFLEQPPLRGQ